MDVPSEPGVKPVTIISEPVHTVVRPAAIGRWSIRQMARQYPRLLDPTRSSIRPTGRLPRRSQRRDRDADHEKQRYLDLAKLGHRFLQS